MADQRYRVEFCPAWDAKRLEKLLNDRAEEGYRVAHFVQMLHQTSEEVWTTVVCEREQDIVPEQAFADSVALEWARPDAGDELLRREMVQAVDDAVIVGDPLLDGGLER